VAVAASSIHSLALKSDDTLWAWGYNGYGQLGDGTTSPARRTTPQLVNLPGGGVAMEASPTHSLAVKTDGTLWTWGWNYYGQLGDEAVSQRLTPGQLPGLTVRL
jgi:alpha-tubulin suppressor-like RCC1 family protein